MMEAIKKLLLAFLLALAIPMSAQKAPPGPGPGGGLDVIYDITVRFSNPGAQSEITILGDAGVLANRTVGSSSPQLFPSISGAETVLIEWLDDGACFDRIARNFSLGLGCTSNTYTLNACASVTISTKPVLTTTAPEDVCSQGPLFPTVVASSGYGNMYRWEYRAEGQSIWRSHPETSERLTLDNIAEFTGAVYDRPIDFRYKISNCSFWSPTDRATFRLPSPTPTLVATPPVCKDENNGKLTITSSGRSLRTNERFRYFLFQDIQPVATRNAMGDLVLTCNGSPCSAYVTWVETSNSDLTGDVNAMSQQPRIFKFNEDYYLLISPELLIGGSWVPVGCGIPSFTGGPHANIGNRLNLALSTSSTKPSCINGNNGSITVSASGGSGSGYQYNINGGSYSANGNFTGLTPGNYTIGYRDGVGCTKTTSVTVGNASEVMSSVSAVSAVCSGNGTITVTAGNIEGTVRYQLESGSTIVRGWQASNVFGSVPPGSYTVRVRDTRGGVNCFASNKSASIASVSLPQINSPAITHPACAGDNGSINVNATGITGTASYRLMQGSTVIRNWQSSDVFNSVPSGSYTVRLRDVRGGTTCNATNVNVTVNTPGSVQITSAPSVAPACPGGTGQITVNSTGVTGTANYRLMQGSTVIRNWQSSNVFINVPSGNYTVRLRDNRGGTNCLASDFPASVATPPTPQITSTPVTDPICAGDPGIITVNSINTTGTVNYRLMQGTTVIRNWQSSNVFSSVPVGSYTVRMRDNRGGTNCFATNASATITPAAPVTITNVTSTQPICAGESTGTVTVTASGILGTASYRLEGSVNYGWQSSNVFGAVQAGSYTVRVRDNRSGTNCFAPNSSVTVTDPPALVAAEGTENNPNCHNEDGTINLTISNGTGPFSYRLNSSSGSSLNSLVNSQNDATPTFTFPTTVPTYLSDFRIHVTDSKGCEDLTGTIRFTNPPQLTGGISEPSSITCNGGTGSLRANPSGGTAPYSYLWSDGQTTRTASGLTAGGYNVVITDNNGCTVNPSFTLNQPSAFNTSHTKTDVTCFGDADGSIDVTVSGATPGYTYLWNDGNTSQDRSGLGPGTYSVTITDATGVCNTVITGITITQPAQLTLSANINDILCNGGTGSVTLVAGGGSGSYQFSLNGTNWQSGASFSGLADGNYTGRVRDANEVSCIVTRPFSITEPALLTGSVSEPVSIDCNGGTGSLRANPTGGTAPYSYLWSDGKTTRTASGLSAGAYNVVITDANGCTTNPSFTLTEPDVFSTSHSSADVTCFGDSDGSINVTVSGATSPYTYLWNDGNTNQDRSGLGPGSYAVTITDANGCTTNINGISINEPAVLTLTATGTDPLCFGQNGSVALSGAGGLGVLSYSIDGTNYQAGANFSNLTPGSYTGYVRDVNLCVTTDPFTITEPTQLTFTPIVTNATCNGSNGEITGTVSGGTLPHTFEWRSSGGTLISTNKDLTSVPSGQYTLYVTDDNSCQRNFPVTVLDEVLDVEISTSQGVTCFGGTDGTATIQVNDGALPLTILWDNGETGLTATNLDAGLHTVDVTDSNGCSDQLSVTIATPTEISIALDVLNDPLCNGSTDGNIQISASGGTGALSVDWSNGQTGNTLSNVGAGMYTVTVTDANGCSVNADYTLTENSPVNASFSTSDYNGFEISCFGLSDGSITLTGVSGGTGVYTYLWSNGATSSAISGISAGTYSVTITDSNGCDFSINNISIDQPADLSVSSGSIIDVTCNSASTGSVTLMGSGGALPYEFSVDGVNWQSSQVISGLAAGSYTGHVRDANNCSATTGFSISEPTAIGATYVINDATCGNANGSATATPSGGVGPYTYSWDYGGSEVSTTSSVTNADIGNYQLTITDANGCTFVDFIVISNQDGAIPTVQASQQPSCFDSSDGSATISISGGVAPYDVLWSSGETTLTATGLVVGNNSVTVTDANGCVTIEQVTFTDPQPISLTSSVIQDPLCPGNSNGSIQITPQGGTGALTALWSDGQTGLTAVNLSEGNYSVDITDANGCVHTENFTLTDPALLQASATLSDFSGFGTTCSDSADGSIDLTVTGGTAPYTYTWSNGPVTEDILNLTTGFYSVTIQDANGCELQVNNIEITSPDQVRGGVVSTTDALCNGSADGTFEVAMTVGEIPFQYSIDNGVNNQASPVFSGLAAGNYQVLATDNRGCTATIDVTIGEPLEITLVPSISNATCSQANGSVSITPSGGTAPYTYSWKNLGGTELSQLATLADVSAGRYTIEVTDANGCMIQEEHTILNERLDFDITASSQPLCHDSPDGTATVTINEGVAPFDILWSSGETGLNASSLVVGLNTVTITDANGCTQIKSVEFTGPAPVQITLVTKSDPTCFGGNDGSIDISVSGGSGVFTYSWTNGETTEDITTLSSGDYTVTVTDSNGCETAETFTINDINPITASSDLLVPSCVGDNDGAINLTVSGGNGSYTYLWSNGATTKDLTGVSAGSYGVTITDQSGCELTESYTLDDVSPLVIGASVSEQLCAQDPLPFIELNVSGGNGGYTYLWNTGAQTNDVFNLTPGSYDVTVTDAKGCQEQAVFVIPNVEALSVTEVITPPQCQGEPSAGIDVTVSGGTGVYTYSWSNGASTEDLSGISSGSYTLTITDSNGCALEETFAVNDINPIAATSVITRPGCIGNQDAGIALSVSGGSGSYTYLWSTGATTRDLTGVFAGDYNVTITDANGCQLEQAFTITDKEAVSISESIMRPSCPGEGNASIDLSVSGGNGGYAYSWSTGAQTEDIFNLSAGNYSVTVTDQNGCEASKDFVIEDFDPITVTSEINTPVCFEESSASINLTVNGGAGSYSYEWSNGSTSQNLTGVRSGDYSVTVTDGNGCSALHVYSIQELEPLAIQHQVSNPVCTGESNASIALTLSGGNGGYSYQWSNGATTSSISNLAAGDYDVVVSDVNGCVITESFTILDPPDLTMELDDVAICENQIFSLTAPVEASVYRWSGPNGFAQSTRTVDISVPGEYFLDVEGENGCFESETFNVVIDNSALDADFLMATEGFVGDTIVVIDISWPVPEGIVWNLPQEGRIIFQSDDWVEMVFDEPGEYAMSIEVTLAGCVASYSQSITIRPREEKEDESQVFGVAEPHIQAASTYPNPSEGIFKFTLELKDESPADLMVINARGNSIPLTKKLSGETSYDVTLDLTDLGTGVFFLRVNSGGESKTIRIFIK